MRLLLPDRDRAEPEERKKGVRGQILTHGEERVQPYERRVSLSLLVPEGLSHQPPFPIASPTQDPAVTAEAM